MADNKQKSDLKERLIQGAVEGIATEVVINAVLPGAGMAVNAMRGTKNLKKVAKVAGKGVAKESIKILDGEEENQDKIEDLGGDLAVELLTRSKGR